MILKFTLSDLDATDKLVKACSTLSTAIHRKRFIFKDQNEYEIEDFQQFDANKARIEKILKTKYDDLGKDDRMWFIDQCMGAIIYYFLKIDAKNIEFYNKNLKGQIVDTYKDVDENNTMVYAFVYSSKVTPAIFVTRQ